ncbi:DNA-binding LytR/AlgR family response regulator [Agromyces flavus]|uniref:DNA-binding LytR/AlgR family response regulator n=1 Tax=Agromyces flavus TaxID=589382 RepID=A0A1H1WEM9_9MICO|nr:LytTR family DNA-binding domain-containing protein [Agromyces flavus]MCP2366155.1 DNA-binding LytR/AlgR family response regulator [Agromyces flavus]GGI44110.1 DNA-binding response regulator [Agromyces flavus]SDS95485.1 DNA-binding response regulator, LytR/AlgR family [Agromyces flavus]
MTQIDVLIADDERPVLDELEALLRRDERVRDIRRASSGSEAIRLLSEHAVDAAFLDIHMPGLSGFDLARALSRFGSAPAIVFVTADEAGAVEAFDFQAVDFILKPIRRERLHRAVSRILAARDSGRGPDVDDDVVPDEHIAVRVGNVMRVVRRSDVRWVQAQGDYSRLVTDSDSHLIREPISDLEERWAAAGFIRVHRSYLVDRAAITTVRLVGAHPTLTVAGEEIPVSRRSISVVREAILQPRSDAR